MLQKISTTAILSCLVVIIITSCENPMETTVTRIVGVYQGIQQKTLLRPPAPDTVISTQVVDVRVATDPDGRYHRTDTSANLYIDGEIGIFSLNNRSFSAPKPNGLGLGGAFFYNDSLSFYNRTMLDGKKYMITFRGKRKK